ncbi:NADPH-dependent oxidoreductase [Mycobacterium sp. 134]|uniref:NADPH-dependent oxidoreductase n=1 Tax=Mycobacterium sp. 134 TaxID=3400425 RepID=UPI003AADF7E8
MTVIARYGDIDAVLGVHSETLALQLAHRSVRKFTAEPVTDEQLSALVAAAQSAATSSNLQPWSVIAIRDPQRKARLATLANNQQFINEAPLFLVWVADLGRARRLAQRSGAALDGADYLETTIIGFVDTALAAQNAVVAAESLGLGTVFVGAIRNHPEEVAAELGLPPHAVATFGLAVGTPDPTENAGIKPRLPQHAVLHRERYDAQTADSHLPAYDERLAVYNNRYGLSGSWSERVLSRLAGPHSLSGRHRLREQLERLGLPSR